MLPLKGVSYHEVHLTMIYYRMKFQSVGSAEFNTAYFHALWFYEVDGLLQERRNSVSNALELCLSCTNPSKWKHFLHADFHVSLMIARTTFWTNTRVTGELRFHSLWFIYFSRPTCMWNSAEIFSWVFPRVQPQYSPKVVKTLRPEQWWLMFGTHFRYIFLTKICSFAELVMKLVCWGAFSWCRKPRYLGHVT